MPDEHDNVTAGIDAEIRACPISIGREEEALVCAVPDDVDVSLVHFAHAARNVRAHCRHARSFPNGFTRRGQQTGTALRPRVRVAAVRGYDGRHALAHGDLTA